MTVSNLSTGGTERVVSELANAWAERGRRVGVMTLSGATTDSYPLHPAIARIRLDLKWNSISVWQTIRHTVQRSLMLRRAVASFDPDVVVSFIGHTNVRVLAALIGRRVPVIVSERTDPRQHPIGRRWNVARRLMYLRAAAVVVQTQAVASWAEEFIPRKKVRVIPNFVRPLRPADRSRSAPVVLAVGRLDRYKGFDVLLRAYAASTARSRGYRLVILGEGPERAALDALSGQLGIPEHVEMPGVVSSPEDWMERAPVFVLPSRYEGFPNVLVEAMAMGCAVIAADCPSGPRDIVKHERDGLLLPPDDVDALASALNRVLEDAPLRERLGRNATEIRERLAVQAVLARWDAVLKEVTRAAAATSSSS